MRYLLATALAVAVLSFAYRAIDVPTADWSVGSPWLVASCLWLTANFAAVVAGFRGRRWGAIAAGVLLLLGVALGLAGAKGVVAPALSSHVHLPGIAGTVGFVVTGIFLIVYSPSVSADAPG